MTAYKSEALTHLSDLHFTIAGMWSKIAVGALNQETGEEGKRRKYSSPSRRLLEVYIPLLL